MILQNSLLEYLSKSRISAMDVKSSQSISKDYTQGFQDILSNSVSKKSEKSTDFIKNDDQYAIKENQKKGFAEEKQARAFSASGSTRSKEYQCQQKNIKNTDNSRDEKEAVPKNEKKTKADIIADSLAEILGLQRDQLQKLLDALKVDINQLSDVSKAGEIADKLADFIGLSTDQAHALNNIILEINKQAEGVITSDKAFVITEEDNGRSENINEDRIVVEGSDETAESIPKDIVENMRMKINTVSGKLAEGQEGFEQVISSAVEKAVSQSKVGEEAEHINAETEVLSEDGTQKLNQHKTDGYSNQSSDNGQEAMQYDGKAAGQGMTDDNEKAFEPAEGSIADKTNAIDGGIVNNAAKNTNPYESLKVGKGSGVQATKNEILDQVVEKAKVILSGEKSEMIMELKPESLGRLALKVVTERGIVVAKFIAESQQVKEVLESNMQLLKDSLEKQGLSVQGFSVSVGQDSGREFRREQFTQNKSGFGGTSSIKKSDNAIYVDNITQSDSKINAYNWNNSSINLTA